MINTCNELTNSKDIVVSENKKEFRIKNVSKKNINKVEVDGCYIKNGYRCDYLFEILQESRIEKVIYVELKGQDIEHGARQLEATINHCKNIHNGCNKEAYIVASKVPRITTKVQKLKIDFMKKNGFILHIKNIQIEITI